MHVQTYSLYTHVHSTHALNYYDILSRNGEHQPLKIGLHEINNANIHIMSCHYGKICPPPFYFISIHLILLLQKKLENILLLPVKLNVNIVIKYSLHYSELIFGFGVIFQTRRTFKVHIFFIEYAHRQCIQIVRQKHTHTHKMCAARSRMLSFSILVSALFHSF